MNKDVSSIKWRGVEVEVSFIRAWSKPFYSAYGFNLCHIEVRAEQPLPITETGYRSIFIGEDELRPY